MTNPLVVQFTGIAGGRLVGALIQALSMVLLARVSGPSGFGIFAAAYGVGLVLQTVLNFGFTPFLVRIRALGDQEPLIASTLEFSRRANLAVGALLALTAAVAAVFEPTLWFVVPLAAWVVLDNYVETLLSLPLADGNTWQNAVSLLLRRALALVFVGAAWLAGVDAVFWYSVGLAFSSMIAVFVAIQLGPAITRVRSRRSYRSIIGKSSHFWLNSVATQTRNFDVLLVGLVTSPAVSGIYGVTSRITTPLRLIPTSFAAVLMPAAARSTTGRIAGNSATRDVRMHRKRGDLRCDRSCHTCTRSTDFGRCIRRRGTGNAGRLLQFDLRGDLVPIECDSARYGQS